jgi:rhodanese-related sulfurtransferase
MPAPISPSPTPCRASPWTRSPRCSTRAARGGRPVFVFDTNDKELFDSGHVPGAIWVPWDGLPAAALPADKAAKLVFYCSNES